jgi:hypothetical protein
MLIDIDTIKAGDEAEDAEEVCVVCLIILISTYTHNPGWVGSAFDDESTCGKRLLDR